MYVFVFEMTNYVALMIWKFFLLGVFRCCRSESTDLVPFRIVFPSPAKADVPSVSSRGSVKFIPGWVITLINYVAPMIWMFLPSCRRFGVVVLPLSDTQQPVAYFIPLLYKSSHGQRFWMPHLIHDFTMAGQSVSRNHGYEASAWWQHTVEQPSTW